MLASQSLQVQICSAKWHDTALPYTPVTSNHLNSRTLWPKSHELYTHHLNLTNVITEISPSEDLQCWATWHSTTLHSCDFQSSKFMNLWSRSHELYIPSKSHELYRSSQSHKLHYLNLTNFITKISRTLSPKSHQVQICSAQRRDTALFLPSCSFSSSESHELYDLNLTNTIYLLNLTNVTIEISPSADLHCSATRYSATLKLMYLPII